jgi:hypothetical protein
MRKSATSEAQSAHSGHLLDNGGREAPARFAALSSMAPDPAVSPGEVLLKRHNAMMRLMEESSVNRRYGRLVFGQLRAHGLVSIGAEARVFMWQRGSPGASMLRANYEQLREAMIGGNYITPQQFEEDVARVDDPDFMMPSGILWSAWGRRP